MMDTPHILVVDDEKEICDLIEIIYLRKVILFISVMMLLIS